MNASHSKKIVVFGGSFNPPHLGHAGAIQNALDNFPCDEVWIMPSSNRWDKTISVTQEDRLAMLELLVKELFSNSKVPVKICKLELERNKLTTTYETMLELKEKFPDYTFYFLIGSDIASKIKTTWIHGDKLFDMGHFVFYARPGYKKSMSSDSLPPHSFLINSGKKLSDISSTFLRDHIHDEVILQKHLSPLVLRYMHDQGLYNP